MGYTLNLDELEEMRLNSCLEQFGAVITGGNPEARKEAVLRHMSGPVEVIDCRTVSDADEFWRRITALHEESLDEHVDKIDAENALTESGYNILMHEFDSMSGELQTTVARGFKGFTENPEISQEFAYTAEAGDAVVRAEPDLRSRVKSWELEESD